MNSSLPGWPGPPRWVNEALAERPVAERPVGRAMLFSTFLKEWGRHRACKTLDTLPIDPESWEQHDPLCTKCQPHAAACLPATVPISLAARGPVTSLLNSLCRSPGSLATWAKWEHSCSEQLYRQGPSPGAGTRQRSCGLKCSRKNKPFCDLAGFPHADRNRGGQLLAGTRSC